MPHPRRVPVLVLSSLFLLVSISLAQSEPAPQVPEAAAGSGPEILGEAVVRGQFQYRSWTTGQLLPGLSVETPVLLVSGEKSGPTLCLTGAIHGDELNGVEIIRRVVFGLDPTRINGTVIGIPIVNLHGFRRSSRYLPDRRDLNRFFPGQPRGSSASRIADSLFTKVIRHCDYLVDIHTGSFHRTNLVQIRANLAIESVHRLTRLFGDIAVLNSIGTDGTLRRAANDAGIAAVTMEVGEPLRLQTEQVAVGVRGIQALLAGLGIVRRPAKEAASQPVYYESTWLRVDEGGILLAKVELGDQVERGQVLGTVTDPITNRRTSITSPWDGRVLGMAINQVVMPGFAAFHLGRSPARQPPAASDSESAAAAPDPGAPPAVGEADDEADPVGEPEDEEPGLADLEPGDHLE